MSLSFSFSQADRLQRISAIACYDLSFFLSSSEWRQEYIEHAVRHYWPEASKLLDPTYGQEQFFDDALTEVYSSICAAVKLFDITCIKYDAYREGNLKLSEVRKDLNALKRLLDSFK